MLKIKNYVRVQSLEEAYDLCQKKNNVVLGGMLWLKMQRRSIGTAIDLSDLGLDQIEEDGEFYRLGAMVSLRTMERHHGLNELTQGAMEESLRHIVGVQFRNLATVGGSLWGRFGFSDVLTLLLALDAQVELYHAGRMSLEAFTQLPRQQHDILTHVLIPKGRARWSTSPSGTSPPISRPSLAPCPRRTGSIPASSVPGLRWPRCTGTRRACSPAA